MDPVILMKFFFFESLSGFWTHTLSQPPSHFELELVGNGDIKLGFSLIIFVALKWVLWMLLWPYIGTDMILNDEFDKFGIKFHKLP
jgi:hypothetical protein